MEKTKLVMVGNGMAGVRALEELLKIAPDIYDITVFGAEPHANYNRILLSPVLAGEMTAGRLSQFVLYAVFAAGGLGELSQVWSEIAAASGAAERLFEILHVQLAIHQLFHQLFGIAHGVFYTNPCLPIETIGGVGVGIHSHEHVACFGVGGKFGAKIYGIIGILIHLQTDGLGHWVSVHYSLGTRNFHSDFHRYFLDNLSNHFHFPDHFHRYFYFFDFGNNAFRARNFADHLHWNFTFHNPLHFHYALWYRWSFYIRRSNFFARSTQPGDSPWTSDSSLFSATVWATVVSG